MHCFSLTVRHVVLPKSSALYSECVHYRLNWAKNVCYETYTHTTQFNIFFSRIFRPSSAHLESLVDPGGGTFRAVPQEPKWPVSRLGPPERPIGRSGYGFFIALDCFCTVMSVAKIHWRCQVIFGVFLGSNFKNFFKIPKSSRNGMFTRRESI